MEENNFSSPVPAPRTKVPVPLPRKVISNEVATPDSGSEGSSPRQSSFDGSSYAKLSDHRDNSVGRSASSIRKSLRHLSVNVQERSSAMIENTKMVGAKLEKSVKNIWKRQSVTSGSENDFTDTEAQPEPEINPIFNNIKFGSPIVKDETNLPPSYPPPPLPDDLYDEISSNKAAESSSPTTESVYEEIPFMKNLSQDSDTESSYSGSKQIFRSDSWNYFTQTTPKQIVKNIESSSGSNSDSGHYALPCEVLHSYENFMPSRVPLNTVYADEAKILNSQNLTPKKTKESQASSGSVVGSRASVANSVYENWGPCHGEDLTLLEHSSNIKPLLLLESDHVICEFDPLFRENPELQKVYESRSKFQENPLNIWEDDGISELSKLAEEAEGSATESVYELASNCSEGSPIRPDETITEEAMKEVTDSNGRKVARWRSMRRAVQRVREGFRKGKPSETLPERPPAQLPTAVMTGYLYRGGALIELPKNLSRRWCQLGEGKLSFAPDKNLPAKDVIVLDNIAAIQLILDPKLSESAEVIHCWELSHGKGKPTVVGCPAPTERRIWMAKILESLTQAFPASLTSNYSRAGWAYLRESINGPWHIAWLLLQKRSLYYSIGKGENCELDLRKATNIEVTSRGDSEQMVVDSQDGSIRLQAGRETRAWAKAVKAAAGDNGTALSDQQLTRDNVPTIVDKCIAFIYAHGCMSEGIYRRSGSNAAVQRLLTELRKDAWAVHLTRDEFSEHDAAAALKRFFRDLTDPLFTSSLHDYLCNIANIKCSKEEKIVMYRNSLEKLPIVNYVTARKLMSHLHFISQQSDKNLMGVDNLAAIWAPTLMHVQDNQAESKWSRQEWLVVHDLMEHFESVFLVGESEREVERRIAAALEAVHRRGTAADPRPSGHLKIWIYVGSRDGPCINVTVEAERTAGALVAEVTANPIAVGAAPAGASCLLEVVLSGALCRPLHHTERVFDTVVRWAYWHHDHRKDNYLLLGPIEPFTRIARAIMSPPLSKMGELKFAGPKMKSFKTYVFEFSQAKLSYFKDSKHVVKLGEWRVEDIVIYEGHDPKRNVSAKWSLTIVPKEYASATGKDYSFGYVIAGAQDDLYEWLSVFYLAQYKPEDVLPPPPPLIPIFTDLL